MREQKRAAVLKEKRAVSGSTSPPRIVVSIVFFMIFVLFLLCIVITHVKVQFGVHYINLC